MSEMMDNDIRTCLEQFGLYEIGKVIKRFKCWRNSKSGESQEITVEIIDKGPDEKYARYMISACRADGKQASCNGANTIEEAIELVHWNQFD